MLEEVNTQTDSDGRLQYQEDYMQKVTLGSDEMEEVSDVDHLVTGNVMRAHQI